MSVAVAAAAAADTKARLQSEQYGFPYHYLVDLQSGSTIRNLGWGLDYYACMRQAASLVRQYAGDDLLDVGCGDGFLLSHLGRDGFLHDRVAMGVDLDERAIAFARAFGHGVDNLSFEAVDLAHVGRSFSLVSLIEVLEHIADDVTPGFLQQVDRVLAPGGHLVVSVPSVVMPIRDKHFRHYRVDQVLQLFPEYTEVERHFVTRKRSAPYHLLSWVLSRSGLTLALPGLHPPLLRWFEAHVAPATEATGAHIQLVLRK
jgi:2-polyprenyl-3-methyl-5-hydroxy-6-metoxy-1,4-benzoquinol methylase